MSWVVVYSKQAFEDAKKLKTAGLKPNAEELLAVSAADPYQNPSRFEKPIGDSDLAGVYSRRINIHDRLVYEVSAKLKTVGVLRMWTHYE